METDIARKVELIFTGELPSREGIERLCATARRERYRAVAVPSSALLMAQHFLDDCDCKISCRIGFPSGAADADVKRYETEFAIDAGAHEIELVPSLAHITDCDYKAVLREIRDVTEAADERPVKVALQPHRWDRAVLGECVQIVLDSGAQYLSITEKDDLPLVRELCGPKYSLVAGVRSLERGRQVLQAGADLIALLAPSPGSD